MNNFAMDHESLLIWICAIGGGAIGVLGGLIGTYFSIRNTNGPRERAFMVKAAVGGWVAVTGFLILMWIMPQEMRPFLWIPYGLLLPIAIHRLNQSQRKIRWDESCEAMASDSLCDE